MMIKVTKEDICRGYEYKGSPLRCPVARAIGRTFHHEYFQLV